MFSLQNWFKVKFKNAKISSMPATDSEFVVLSAPKIAKNQDARSIA
jgi:hypothetical protein